MCVCFSRGGQDRTTDTTDRKAHTGPTGPHAHPAGAAALGGGEVRVTHEEALRDGAGPRTDHFTNTDSNGVCVMNVKLS